MSLLIKNIRTLVHTESEIHLKYSGAEMAAIQTIDNAFVHCKDDKISSFGKMDSPQFLQLDRTEIETTIDATGKHGAIHIHTLFTQEIANRNSLTGSKDYRMKKSSVVVVEF